MLFQKGEDTIIDFEEFEVADFRRHFTLVGKTATDEAVEDWLEIDKGDPGIQLLSEAEIASLAVSPDQPEEDDKDEDKGTSNPRPLWSKARDAAELLLDVLEHPTATDEM